MKELICLSVFIALSTLFAILMVLAGFLCQYKKKNKVKNSTYECGIEPISDARIEFDVRYFNYAVMFLIFDIETWYIPFSKEIPVNVTTKVTSVGISESYVEIDVGDTYPIKAKLNDNITVEEIQDLVEESLMNIDRYRVAKAYILYRNKRTELRNKPWNMSELQKSILANKYLQPGETFDQWLERVSGGDKELEKLMRQKKFLFAGRILANRGLSAKGIKVTYSNCYVVTPPSDSIEGIYEAAYKLARTFSYGGC